MKIRIAFCVMMLMIFAAAVCTCSAQKISAADVEYCSAYFTQCDPSCVGDGCVYSGGCDEGSYLTCLCERLSGYDYNRCKSFSVADLKGLLFGSASDGEDDIPYIIPGPIEKPVPIPAEIELDYGDRGYDFDGKILTLYFGNSCSADLFWSGNPMGRACTEVYKPVYAEIPVSKIPSGKPPYKSIKVGSQKFYADVDWDHLPVKPMDVEISVPYQPDEPTNRSFSVPVIGPEYKIAREVCDESRNCWTEIVPLTRITLTGKDIVGKITMHMGDLCPNCIGCVCQPQPDREYKLYSKDGAVVLKNNDETYLLTKDSEVAYTNPGGHKTPFNIDGTTYYLADPYKAGFSDEIDRGITGPGRLLGIVSSEFYSFETGQTSGAERAK